MRRAVQSALARQQLLLSPFHYYYYYSSTPYFAPRKRSMSFLMGIGFVCADCRRYLPDGGKRRRGMALPVAAARARKKYSPGGGGRMLQTMVPGACGEGQEGLDGDGARKDKEPPEHHSTEDESTRLELGEKPLMEYVEDTVSIEMLNNLTRKNAAAFERLLKEADVATTEVPRLVDEPRFSRLWTLWRTLAAFRKRMHRDQGVKDVWKGMRMRRVDMPTNGKDADALWSIFVATALRDEEFAKTVVAYAVELSERSNHRRQWSRLYEEIMLHYLVNESRDSLEWHWRLFPVHVPRSWAAFFASVTEEQSSSRCQRLLRRIHSTIADPGLYVPVIQDLCTRGMYCEALLWNRHFIRYGDLPKDSAAADMLIGWVAQHGTIVELRRLFCSFYSAGIQLVESSAVVAVTLRRNPHLAVNLIFEDGRFLPSVLGDAFWATLFDTSLTPKEVFRYALLHGTGCIVGPLTVQKAMAALQRSSHDTVGLLELTGLWVELDATMPKRREPSPTDVESNDRLKHHLLCRKIRDALKHIEMMRSYSMILTRDSVTLLVDTLLRPRRKGKNPSTVPHEFQPGKDIDTVIGVLLSLQRSGTIIPFHLWNGLFRRLGKARRLRELEWLVFRLIKVYKKPELPERSSENPLRKLFVPTLLRALVEWGFLHNRYEPTWGVRVVRMMGERGVHVDVKSVQRAVRVRMDRVPEEIQAQKLLKKVEEEREKPIWKHWRADYKLRGDIESTVKPGVNELDGGGSKVGE